MAIKKIISAVFISLSFCVASQIVYAAQKGDVNGDGSVNAADLDLLKDRVSKNEAYKSEADLDNDSHVDSYDVYRLTHLIDGTIPLNVGLPVREFKINTKSKTIFLTENSGNNEGELKEYNKSGKKIKEWDMDYEWKGSSRRSCEPPVLNIQFDKDDKDGNPKELFTAGTTVPGLTTLHYRKTRFMPECDLWEDYGGGWGNGNGFYGESNPLLREYFIFSLFRRLKVPAIDVVGFANVKIDSSDRNISQNDSWRYFILQRDNQEDDEIPFVNQFNLDPKLEESGDTEGVYRTNIQGDAFSYISYQDQNGVTKRMDFDPDNSIRYFLFTDFTNLQDRGEFHNDDYGLNLATQKWNTIPFGLDMSFTCGISNRPNSILNKINDLPAGKRAEFKAAYYKVAKEIFDNPDSLNEMLLSIDKFPFDVKKTQLKEYLKLTFYNYAKYFGSREFASDTGHEYAPFIFPLPMSGSAYDALSTSFNEGCRRIILPEPPMTIHIDDQALTATVVKENTPEGQRINETVNGIYHVSITASTTAITIPKSGAFGIEMVSANPSPTPTPSFTPSPSSHSEENKNVSLGKSLTLTYVPLSGITPNIGPYYVIPAGRKVTFFIQGTISGSELDGGTYAATLKRLFLGPDYDPVTVSQNQTSSVSVLGNQLPQVTSVNPARPLIGDTVTLRGTRFAPNNNIIRLTKFDTDWNPVETKDILATSTESGTIIRFIPSQYGLTEGEYNGIIIHPQKGQGGNFSLRIYPDYSSVKIINGESPVLSLEYDSEHKESGLTATFKVSVTSTSTDIIIPNRNPSFSAFSISLINDSWGGSQSQNVTVASTTGVTEIKSGYFIPKGQIGTFTIVSAWNPQTLIGGTYYATLRDVYLGENYDFSKIAPNNKTNSLEILGERNPTIRNFYPNPLHEQDTATIQGINFSTTTNVLHVTSRDGTSKEIILPSQNVGWGDGKIREITFSVASLGLTPGSYSLVITANGDDSSPMDFDVIRTQAQVSVTSSQLGLTYDPEGKEALLTSDMTFEVAALERDLVFYKGSVSVQAYEDSGKYSMWPKQSSVRADHPNSKDTADTFFVPAGETRKFIGKFNFDPKIMFSGVYFAALQSIYVDLGKWGESVVASHNESNKVTVIGELSPYILSAEPYPVFIGGTFTIRGLKLKEKDNIVKVDDKQIILPSFETPDPSIRYISFIPQTQHISLGEHVVTILDSKNGASNPVSMRVENEVSIEKISFMRLPPPQNETIQVDVTVRNNTNSMLQNISLSVLDQKNWGKVMNISLEPGEEKEISLLIDIQEIHYTYNPHNFRISVLSRHVYELDSEMETVVISHDCPLDLKCGEVPQPVVMPLAPSILSLPPGAPKPTSTPTPTPSSSPSSGGHGGAGGSASPSPSSAPDSGEGSGGGSASPSPSSSPVSGIKGQSSLATIVMSIMELLSN